MNFVKWQQYRSSITMVMGRVVSHRQSIDTQTYNLSYGYNLAGQLTSETYPSGKVISTNYDTGGRLASIKNGTRFFLKSVGYQGTGNSVNSLALGNLTSQSFAYNDRLQMTNQTLAKGADILQKYDYGYGQIDSSGNLDTSKNNGQLGKIDSTIGTQKQWTQKFSYDSIGRLSEASELRGDTSALSYKQHFDYDRFGNLYRKNASNPTAGQQNPLFYTPIEDADFSKEFGEFLELLKTVYLSYKLGSEHEKREMVQITFSNCTAEGKSLIIELKKPLQVVLEREKFPVGSPTLATTRTLKNFYQKLFRCFKKSSISKNIGKGLPLSP